MNLKLVALKLITTIFLVGCIHESEDEKKSSVPSYGDPESDLIWHDDYYSERNSRPNAESFCKRLESAYFGWRLPTVEELEKAYEIRSSFKQYEEKRYWSSTRHGYNYIVGQSTYKTVDFSNGAQGSNNQYNNGYVRCVR